MMINIMHKAVKINEVDWVAIDKYYVVFFVFFFINIMHKAVKEMRWIGLP